jgi:starch-binding outer membrane protein, SusD/RagB family
MSSINNKQNKKEFSTVKSRVMLASLVVALAAMALTGCKKFLDVQPQNKVPQTTLFKDEQGFKDALTGVYLGMDKTTGGGMTFGLYTNDLTMGMISTLAFEYDNATTANAGTNGTFFNNVVYYYYTDATVRAEIDGIWTSMYTNIANLNNIISQIDSRKSIFTADNFDRIKGEAVALRALFHFDLARMFGQSPATGMNVKAIPYIRSFGVRSTPFATLQHVLDSCIDDLSTAKELLANTDTTAVQKAGDDAFTAYTQNHMNYWAVQAMMARVYLYKGDRDNADKYAKAVIGSNKFPLITSNVASANLTPRDRTFSQELVFSLYSNNVRNSNGNLFDKPSNTTPLRLLPAGKTTLYVTGSGSTNDYRYTSWFDNNQAAVNVPSKYFQNTGLPYHLQNIVPLIRASEMYYIAAEAAQAKGDISGGASFLNKVRQARGLNALNASGITNTDSLSREIMKEYQKEFIQEGQTFFYYKRLNKDLRQVTATNAAIPADVYVFPIPEKEKEYN